MVRIKILCLISTFLIHRYSQAQSNAFTQIVKGIVVDADSKEPLGGIMISFNSGNIKTVTDSTGNFKMTGIPVGLHDFSFSGMNYETKTYHGIEINSGKEVFLEARLSEKVNTLEEVIIRANKKQNTVVANEFASASARAFSMEDSKKYPITGFDPGRIAQNFAGVTMTEDNSNAIVIRGNSPKGILWKLEGIEI
ncbi:MAG: carboxypeptidase-like regulatory domain-containing protein, partial [Saprospiraceae bacterium]